MELTVNFSTREYLYFQCSRPLQNPHQISCFSPEKRWAKPSPLLKGTQIPFSEHQASSPCPYHTPPWEQSVYVASPQRSYLTVRADQGACRRVFTLRNRIHVCGGHLFRADTLDGDPVWSSHATDPGCPGPESVLD